MFRFPSCQGGSPVKPCPRGAELVTQFETWYGSGLGREVAAQEAACLAEMLEGIFGHYLLQVGGHDVFREAMATSHVRHAVTLPPRLQPGGWGMRIAASPEAMPIASDSLDAVFLPHTLDFAGDPRQVLRETERVLIPEGRLLIFGFNALSPWALVRLARPGRMPWCGGFLTRYRVADWLSLLGFDVEMQRMLVFQAPWGGSRWCSGSMFASLGSRYWPALGGIYALRAVKRVSTLTPLRPSWKTRRKLLPGGAVEPTARGTSRPLSNRSLLLLTGERVSGALGGQRPPADGETERHA
jgi:SAM-dependent methyltransferase